MTDLVISTINGKTSLSKRHGPRSRIEKPLGREQRIALTEIEAEWSLDELGQALEFGMLHELMLHELMI